MLLFVLGLAGLLIGQYFRIAAEFTAKHNFSHVISTEKEENHRLVRHGVYSYNKLTIEYLDILLTSDFLFGQWELKS